MKRLRGFITSSLATLFGWGCLALVMSSIVLHASFWFFSQDLPDYDQLAEYEPSIISRIFSAEGRLLDEFANERRLFSPIEEIPEMVKNAFISAEDKNFYQHSGYDPIGIAKAFAEAIRGERLRGASTITQQVMKNFLLTRSRSVERKIKEILLASRLERTLSKNQILELYLNEIFLGQNSYGVTAAAQTYFNRPLEKLTIEEVAYLAALPKAPSRYHPVRAKKTAEQRRNFVINEMVENGYISEQEGIDAMQSQLKTVMSGDFASFRSTMPPRSYFTNEIRRELSGTFGEDQFFNGGLTIRATIDEELQETAAQSLRKGLEKYDRERSRKWRGTGLIIDESDLTTQETWKNALKDLNLPHDIPGWKHAVVLEFTSDGAKVGIVDESSGLIGFILNADISWIRLPSGNTAKSVEDVLKTGEVIFVQKIENSDDNTANLWTLKQIPEVQGSFMAMDVNSGRVLAIHGGFSYADSVFNRATQANRQPGSAFKPFVYAAALDSGYTPATIVLDAPIEIETPQGIWRPKNSNDKFFGPVPLRTGMEYSRNLMTIRLAADVGMDTVANYAETFGLYNHMDSYLANALGAQETTLYKMVAAYAMFANGGERVDPTLIDRVQNRRGETIYKHDQRLCLDCDQPNLIEGTIPQIFSHRMRVMDPITAYQVTAMMQGVVERGTASLTVKPGVPVAGKTGTTNDSQDAWFIGFTPGIVAGCYIGFDTPKSLGRHAYGSNLCGPVFNEFIIKTVEKYGSSEFEPPSGGNFVDVDRTTGEPLLVSDTNYSERAIQEFFRFGSEPNPSTIRVIDGGFAMAADLGIYDPKDDQSSSDVEADKANTQERGSFGSLSSGGLY